MVKKVFKYFIGNENDSEKLIPLCIMLPKRSAYGRDFDETNYTSLLVKDEKLSEKNNNIFDKVSEIIKSPKIVFWCFLLK